MHRSCAVGGTGSATAEQRVCGESVASGGALPSVPLLLPAPVLPLREEAPGRGEARPPPPLLLPPPPLEVGGARDSVGRMAGARGGGEMVRQVRL
jgi:hypothetical protein